MRSFSPSIRQHWPVALGSILLLIVLAPCAPALGMLWPRLSGDEPEEVDLSLLISIEYVEGEPLPEEVQKLDGKHALIRGFMDPTQFTPDKIAAFRLVSDSCGCSGRPMVSHFVEVTLEEEVDFSTSVVTLEGKLQVGEVTEDEFVVSIYRLKGKLTDLNPIE